MINVGRRKYYLAMPVVHIQRVRGNVPLFIYFSNVL